MSYFKSQDDLEDAANRLQTLGKGAIRLLQECVEEQTIKKKKISEIAEKLCEEGFLFIRDQSDCFASEFTLSPTLEGEEVLEALEARKNTKPRKPRP